MTAPDTVSTDSPDFESILSMSSLDSVEASRSAEAARQTQEAAAPAEEASADGEGAVSSAIDEDALSENLAESLDLEMENDFGALVRSAAAKIGGEILFEVENVPDSGHVAAVSMGAGEQRRFVLVIQPSDGSPLRVEPAEESVNPLAALAESYAGLVDAYKKAA